MTLDIGDWMVRELNAAIAAKDQRIARLSNALYGALDAMERLPDDAQTANVVDAMRAAKKLLEESQT